MMGSEAYARCRHWQVWGSARPAVRDPLHAKAPAPADPVEKADPERRFVIPLLKRADP